MAQPRKLHDRFFLQAKAEGYAARSAYKLLEIQKRRQILRGGDRVVDLGCSPGSWVQVASEIVGPRGLVVGVDLKPVAIDALPNARTVVGDAFTLDASDLFALAGEGGGAAESGKRFDVLLSDMAPSTEGGGGGTADHLRSIALCRRVLELAPRVLRKGGHLVMKVFEGEEYPALLRETGALFEDVKGFKPEASRDVSREMFVVAKGFRAAGAAAPKGPPPGIARAAPAPREGWGRPRTGGAGVGGGGGGRP